MERLLPKRRLNQTPSDRSPKKPLIAHYPSITSDVEEPQSVVAFKTTQLRKDRLRRDVIKSAPLFPRSEPDSKIRLALYTSSYDAISKVAEERHSVERGVSYHERDDDPILAHITTQRSRLGLKTVPTKCPDEAEGDNYRQSLLATTAPIAGVKDLKNLSRKLSHMRVVSEGRLSEREAMASDFVYALERQKTACGAKFNPYDLYIVPAEVARRHGKHYTISTFSISEVDKYGNLTPVHVLRWLWERDVLNKLWAIPFFKKFKMWRLFTGWRKWIYTKKFSSYKKNLQVGLFSADVVFQKALLEVQEICMRAAGASRDRTLHNEMEISLIAFRKDKTYTLSEFMSSQDEVCSQAKDKLVQLRLRILEVVFSALMVVGERECMYELNSSGIPQEPDEEPTHTRVLEWRSVRLKLRRFEQMCSNLILNLLQRLVLTAITTLEKGIRRAFREATKCTGAQKEAFVRMREEIVSQPYTQGVLDRQEYAEQEEVTEDMELLALQASSFSELPYDVDMDFFTSSELVLDESLSCGGSALNMASSVDTLDEILKGALIHSILPLWEVQLKLLKCLTPEGLDSHKVVHEPSADQFQESLQELFLQYEEVISSFVPISRDPRIRPFLQHCRYDLLMLLKDPKEDSVKPDPWPNVKSLLHEYGPYLESVAYIKKIVAASMRGVEELATHYRSYGELTLRCSGVDIAASLQAEDWTVAMFQRAFALYHDQVHAINHMVTSFLVGVVGVKAREFMDFCLSYPNSILKDLEYEFPKLVAEKADHLISDIKNGTDKMLVTPADMSAFIQFLSDVTRVEGSVPHMETRLTTITNLYNVAQQFDVRVCEEEMALYKSLFTRFRQLKNALMQAQATKSECVYQFSASIRSQMVEILHRAMDLKLNSETQLQQDETDAPTSLKPLDKISVLKSELDALVKQSKKYVEYYHLFAKIPSTKHYYTLDPSSQSWTPEEVYDEVQGVQEFMKTKMTLYETKESWETKTKEWYSAPLLSLDMAQVKKDVTTFVKTVDHLEKCTPANHKLLQLLHSQVVQFSSWLPTLMCLLNPALKFRHWDLIRNQTGGKLTLSKDTSFTINDLKEIKIFEYHSSIAMISNQANHEETLENMLKKISMEWTSKEFDMVAYKGLSERTTFILSGVEEIFASLEDSLTVLNIIKSSRYVGPIRHAVLDWVSRLTLALETVEYWVLCQKNWLYLENVFTAVDIQRQLNAETRMFLQADKSWREVIRLIKDKTTALKAVTTPGVLEAFRACNILLEQVFKSLEDYLESKRVACPRLNFISNTELLDILSHSKDLTSVQPYFGKLFGNIKKLEFSDEKVSPPIVAMVSAEDERIKITRKCFARGSPEQWLSSFEEIMQLTVKDLLKAGMRTYNKEIRRQWSQANPGQIVLTVSQIHWTLEVIDCLCSSSPHSYLSSHHQEYSTSLAETASLLRNENLLPSKRCIISSLLTLDLHNRDVIGVLISSGITSTEDFEWTRHLRYYWDVESDICVIRQSCASFNYINEYLGCLTRLVITPLSERCYLTLTTAMHLHLGGSPIGPAGTGKSETVKDLAKALGQLCIVINCSEGLDYKMMGRYFSGLCQSGIWCCFDEFNRIDVEVLSVVSQQLQCIKTAKDSSATSFIFEGRDVKLVPSCSLFITMNPSYTGRVELPDNLKSYFRPVAMMVPDTNMITEVLLFINCFTTASTLALKVTKFYEMIKSQISHQNHYYFGLRSVKAVIGLAGEYLKSSHSEPSAEIEALLTAIKNTTLPRLVARDVPTVQIILWDLFHKPDSKSKDETSNKLNTYIEAAISHDSLEHSPSQVQKCHELYNTLLVRHGVILLGPTGGGKSSVVSILAAALNRCYTDYYGPKSFHAISTEPSSMMITGSLSQAFTGKPNHCRLETMNPKSISVGELYGHSDKFTLEWKNGVLARILLSFCVQTEYELYYGDKEKGSDGKDSTTDVGKGASSYAGNASLTGLSSRSSLTASMYQATSSYRFGLPYPACAPAGWRWAMLDGPVDSEWIENLNSVLDDSMVLCLSNGERIKLMPGSRVLFESDSLANASPATVSRCAVIFLDPYELGWEPLVKSWLKTLPDDIPSLAIEHIFQLFEHSVDAGLDFLKLRSADLACPVPGLSAIKTLCCIMDGLLRSIAEYHGGFTEHQEPEVVEKPEEDSTIQLHAQTLAGIYIPTRTQNQLIASKVKMSQVTQSHDLPLYHRAPDSLCDVISNLFVFAFTWAFGGCFQRFEEEVDLEVSGDDLSDNELPSQKISRGGDTALEEFDALVYDLFSEGPTRAHLPPSARLIYMYYPDIYTNTFQPFEKLISSPAQNVTFLSPASDLVLGSPRFIFKLFSDPNEETYSASRVSMIPTVDIIRISFLISVMIESSQMPNIIVSGRSGVGKTQLLSYLSKSISSKKWRKLVIQTVLGKTFKVDRNDEPEEDPRKDVEDHTFSTLHYHVSTQLDSQRLQNMLGSYLMRQGKSLLLPPTGKKLLAFLDDMHAAPCDDYGTSPSLELLRQLIDGGGWYSRKSLMWKDVVGVNFLVTQCTTGALSKKKLSVSERLLSKFHLLNLPEATCRSLFNIYSTHVFKAFTAHLFSKDVLNCVAKLTALGIFVLHTSRTLLTPSPLTPQYTFCLKDLSKAFSRLLRLHHRSLSDEGEVDRLLINELAKVFHDRCVPDDRDKVLVIISEGFRRYFKSIITIEKMMEQLVDMPYTDFLDSTKGYFPVSSKHKLSRHFERIQAQLNLSEETNSQLLFFPLACDQIVRMVRILQLPHGHILLIGLGGVGRRSCVQLAAFTVGMKYHCITPVHPKAPFSDCLEEIKQVLKQCAVHNQPTVLLATDSTAGEHQDAFFSVMHELVVGGEVLSLYDKDEIEIILSQLTEEITVKDTDTGAVQWSPEDLKNAFIKRVFSNLRVVLCFSPVSAKLAEVCRKFPGLVTNATVDMFDEWPPKAMFGVAIKEIQTVKNSHLLKDSITEIAQMCVKLYGVVHSASRRTDTSQLSFVVTPSSFIQFIMTFTRFLDQEHDKLNMKRIHLELGVSHLTGADEKVVQMKSELQLLQPQVLGKAEEVEQLLQELDAEQKEVDTLRASVFQERMDIAKETERVTSLAREAEEDLQSVLPKLKAAEKGLNSLKKSDLTEIRSYGTPPAMVMNVMSSVCVLLKEPTEWNAIKHIMADPVGFLRRLTSVDKDNVSDKVLAKLKKYTRDPNFSADKMVHYSVACQSFCQWVLAIEGYCKVYRVVQPKRELHWKISAELEAVVGRLQAKELQLSELRARMAVLTDECAVKKEERDRLQEKYKQIELQLGRAQILMESLDYEKKRWKETLSDLESKTSTLIGDSLLLSSCLTFLGPFTPHVRHSLLGKWKHLCHEGKICCDGNFSLEGTLCDSEKVQEWYVQGLPKDTQSLQNAALLTTTEKCPYIVDPQAQAIKWLKAMFATSHLMIQEYGSSKIVHYLESAARTGVPLMITGVPEQLSSVLDPFLQTKSSDESGDRQFIKMGKTEIECSPSFKLFLVSSKLNQKLPSDTCTKTTVINFSATLEGYQDQLLSATINIKEPTLESQFNELLLSISYDTKQLERLEQKLLECLSSSTGDLLEDEVLIGTLKDATHTASEVKERLQKAFETRESISNSRLKYERVAKRGSILFFTVLSLRNLDPVYTFSSDWFMDMFRSCVISIRSPNITGGSQDSEEEEDYIAQFKAYVNRIVDFLTVTVYKKVSYGILSKHSLLFSFKLCTMLLMHQDDSLRYSTTIRKSEWIALLRGSMAPDSELAMDSQHSSKLPVSTDSGKLLKPDQISYEAWEGATLLDKALLSFNGLLAHIIQNVEIYVELSKSEHPWLMKFSTDEVVGPTSKSKRRSSSARCFALSLLNNFQRLVLINVFCPHQFAASARWLIETEMGSEFTVRPPCDLETIYPLTSTVIPALIIITPNVDPTAQLLQLALDHLQFVDTISLGQGQGEKATRHVWLAAKTGRWVFLQNCHLASSWMPQLETLIKELQACKELHENFRLWLSSKSTTVLPHMLLQSSIKVCLEAPTSIKSNMHQVLSSRGAATISSAEFDYGDVVEWQQLVFRLCLFHSVVNARRAYGSEGWRVPYVFGPNDLKVSVQLLQNVFKEQTGKDKHQIAWGAVHHLVGDICYGGKVTTAQDQRTLRALLRRNCSPQSIAQGYRDIESGSIGPGLRYDTLARLIETLPDADTPDTLGLSPVLQSTLVRNESKSLLSMLCLLETTTTKKSYLEKKRDEVVLERVQEFLQELPPPLKSFTLSLTSETDPPSCPWSTVSPFWAVLCSEVAALNEKLLLLNASLIGLEGEIRGELVEDECNTEYYRALSDNLAPETWKFGQDAPPSLPDWREWFMRHYNFFDKWMCLNASAVATSNFSSPPKLPSKFWLPAFKYTNGFFEAIKQHHARKANVPVEDISVKFDDKSCLKKVDQQIDPVIISGMKLGLAEWDSDKGLVQTTTTEQYSAMPDMVCYPIHKSLSSGSSLQAAERQSTWYPCPLYSSSAKQDYISTIALRTSEQPDHLDMIGIALTL